MPTIPFFSCLAIFAVSSPPRISNPEFPFRPSKPACIFINLRYGFPGVVYQVYDAPGHAPHPSADFTHLPAAFRPGPSTQSKGPAPFCPAPALSWLPGHNPISRLNQGKNPCNRASSRHNKWCAATGRRTPHSCHQRHRKFRTPVGSIKLPSRLKPLQSRLIVPNQASSRHPMKKLIPSSPRASVAVECGGMPPLWHWETCIPVPCPDLPAHSQPSRHPTRIPKSGFQSRLLYSIKPQSRQKTQQSCLIKANQGIL